MAKTETVQEPQEEVVQEIQETVVQEPQEELVTIKLFKDNENYKDDVFVGVNGQTWQIQRGIEVKVPPCVAEVLDHSQQADTAAARRIEAEERKYEKERQQYGN